MPFRIGTQEIDRIYLGTQEVDRIYLGSTLVYEPFQAGSLVIEDDTLEVAGGGTVNLRVKLGAKPRSNVRVDFAEASALISRAPTFLTFTPQNWDDYQHVVVSAEGNQQTITLLNSWWGRYFDHTQFASFPIKGWGAIPSRNANYPVEIISGLRPANKNRYFANLLFPVETNRGNRVVLTIEEASRINDIINTPNDLSDTFETSGSIELIFGNMKLIKALNSSDIVEPYNLVLGNPGIQFYNAVNVASDRTATLILRDYVPPAQPIPINLSASGPDEYSGVTDSATVSVT